jgi:hypothetical protein
MHPDLRRWMHHRLKSAWICARRVTGSTARRERRCRHTDRAATGTRTHAALERQSGSSTPGPRPRRVRRSRRSPVDRSQGRQDVRRRTPLVSVQRRSRLTLHPSAATPARDRLSHAGRCLRDAVEPCSSCDGKTVECCGAADHAPLVQADDWVVLHDVNGSRKLINCRQVKIDQLVVIRFRSGR